MTTFWLIPESCVRHSNLVASPAREVEQRPVKQHCIFHLLIGIHPLVSYWPSRDCQVLGFKTMRSYCSGKITHELCSECAVRYCSCWLLVAERHCRFRIGHIPPPIHVSRRNLQPYRDVVEDLRWRHLEDGVPQLIKVQTMSSITHRKKITAGSATTRFAVHYFPNVAATAKALRVWYPSVTQISHIAGDCLCSGLGIVIALQPANLLDALLGFVVNVLDIPQGIAPKGLTLLPTHLPRLLELLDFLVSIGHLLDQEVSTLCGLLSMFQSDGKDHLHLAIHLLRTIIGTAFQPTGTQDRGSCEDGQQR
mmetsp:Transcript_59034/g.129411  ORF Transcript_59034/g.129411 Transcript_59034/m.129411 type:complete len:308 (-) Transcript_59034:90-1013(-)